MTPASVLYSLRTEIDREGATRYRITKFVDGEVESSYHVDRSACECPAGVRPTCRHRQMLPQMLNADIANTHWFYDHDHGGRIVDFEGTTREFYEHVEAEAYIDRNPSLQPHSVTVSTGDFDSPSGGSNPPAVATPNAGPRPSWRRL